ncbi:MAG: TatD family hydrolase [bacterium]|nr:TatD family hydrolase [bacterium]
MDPRLYDTHAHVQFNAFKDDGHAVIARALAAGVWMNLVGSQIDTSKRAIEYAEQYPEGVYALIALHPIHLFSTHVDEDEIQFKSREETFDPAVYRELAKSKKVVGIGECGLDYYRLDDYTKVSEHSHDAPFITERTAEVKKRQKEVFLQHIELAIELNLPIEIHCREAYDDVYEIVKKYPKLRAIMHCYLGDAVQAKKFLELGFLLSFSGIVTFKNAKALQEIARTTPLDRIVVETDCPYLTPEPHRGQRNEPAYVEWTAKKIADLKGATLDEVARATTANARKFFKI